MNLSLRIGNYIARYAPSKRKLEEYMTKKKYSWEREVLYKELGYTESLMCDMWMRTFLARSSGEREIRMKLMKKWFPKELIIEKLESSLDDIRDWSSHSREIESMRDTLLKRGKSIQFIRMTLTNKYPYFRDEISELFEWVSDDTWLECEIEKYRSKYDLSNSKERQKFYAAIQRKGFRYSEIAATLRKEEE